MDRGAYIRAGWHGSYGRQVSHQGSRPTFGESGNGKIQDRTLKVGIVVFEIAVSFSVYKPAVEDLHISPFGSPCNQVVVD